MIAVKKFKANDQLFQRILARAGENDAAIAKKVSAIIAAVRSKGDKALLGFTQKFDKVKLNAKKLRVQPEEFEAAMSQVDEGFIAAVTQAKANIRRFHEYQSRSGYVHDDGDGVLLSKRVLPLRRVGVCCPARNAPLFSSMLMNVIPAQVAGVKEIAAVIPPRADGSVEPHMLATAKLLGVTEIYRVGGAQAVAALAYGTESIARVDKIAGPGNAWVVAAKRQVFGAVGIDSLAGPSEVAIICDRTANPAFVAADMLSQVEHGSGMEAGVVFTDDASLPKRIKAEVIKQLKALPRSEAIKRALSKYGAIFVVKNLDEAAAAVNLMAPEHLEIHTADPEAVAEKIENAGAIFLGEASSEPVGDYFCGTNHVLPTGGSARFSGSLSVYDFVKDQSIVKYNSQRLLRTGRHIAHMADLEGLGAHAAAVRIRLAAWGEVAAK